MYTYRLLHMAFFISYPLSAQKPTGKRDDIWPRADKGYDMKNDMLWHVYHNTSTEEITDLYQNVKSFLARIKYIQNCSYRTRNLLFYCTNIREKIGS